jgi:hypothetical protein
MIKKVAAFLALSGMAAVLFSNPSIKPETPEEQLPVTEDRWQKELREFPTEQDYRETFLVRKRTALTVISAGCRGSTRCSWTNYARVAAGIALDGVSAEKIRTEKAVRLVNCFLEHDARQAKTEIAYFTCNGQIRTEVPHFELQRLFRKTFLPNR